MFKVRKGVRAISELACVAISRRGGQGLQTADGRGPSRNLAGRLFLALSPAFDSRCRISPTEGSFDP